jgi:hypothetical protein
VADVLSSRAIHALFGRHPPSTTGTFSSR